jgi:tetratricopeptide (TPR) repeat protein
MGTGHTSKAAAPPMRRFNVKLFGILIAILIPIIGGVHLLHRFQVRRGAATLRTRAELAQKAGDVNGAVRYLHMYLGHEPEDVEAQTDLANLLYQSATTSGDKGQAYLALSRVLELDPTRSAARRKLVDVSLGLGRITSAMDHLKKLQAESPQDPVLSQLVGKCHLAVREYDRAARAFLDAIDRDPHLIESYGNLANVLYSSMNRPLAATNERALPDWLAKLPPTASARDQADATVNAMVDANADSAQAYMLRGTYRRDRGQLSEAAADLGRAREIAPTDTAVLRAAAALALDQSKLLRDQSGDAAAADELSNARAFAAKALELDPKVAATYALAAEIEMEARDPNQAVAMLRRGHEALPRNGELVAALIQTLIRSGGVDEARKSLGTLRDLGATRSFLDYFDGWLLTREHKWMQASKKLLQIRPKLADRPAYAQQVDILLGDCYGQLMNPDLQLAAYTRAIDLDPSSVEARQRAARSLATLGRIDDAIGQLRLLMGRSRVPANTLMDLVRYMILRNLRLPKSDRDWREVNETLSLADAVATAAPDVAMLRAEIDVATDQIDAAIARVEEARKAHSDRLDLGLLLSSLRDRQKKPDLALKILDDLEQQHGDLVDLRLMRARHWITLGGDDNNVAERLRGLERGAEQFSEAERSRLRFELGLFFRSLSLYADAARVWGQIAQEDDHALAVRMTLFDLANQASDDKEMVRWIEELKRVEGADGTNWQFAELRRLVSAARSGNKDSLSRAQKLLTEIEKDRPGWPRLALTRADLNDLIGNVDVAIQSYQRALELGDSDPRVVQRLAQLLFQRGKYEEADRVIKKLESGSPLSPQLTGLASAISLRTHDLDRAIALARQAVASDPAEPTARLWLASVLSAAGKSDEAISEIRQAVQAPASPAEAWMMLVGELAKTQKKDEVDTTLQDVRTRFPSDKFPLVLAQCFLVAGQRDKADAEFDAALRSQPNDSAVVQAVVNFYLNTNQAGKAEPPLRRVLQDKDAFQSIAPWARRSLAVVLASQPNYDRFREAIALVDQNIRDAGEPPPLDDLRAKATLLSTRNLPGHRVEFTRLLGEINRRQPLRPEERYLLARMHSESGNWSAYQSEMLTLLATKRDEPKYIATYARDLLRRSFVTDARPWVSRLIELDPNSQQTAEMRTRVLAAENKPKEAIALLVGHTERQAGDEQQKAQSIGEAALLLEELSLKKDENDDYWKAAEKMYRQFASDSAHPERVFALANFLAHRGRLDDALDLCEGAWKTCPAELAGRSSASVLRSSKPTEAQFTRVERWLNDAINGNPSKTAFILYLADVKNNRERFSEAAALYTRALQMEGNNVIALNNLAWLFTKGLGGNNDALRLVNHAIDVAGPLSTLLDTRAAIYIAMDKLDDAVKDLERAIDATPSKDTYFHLAHASLLRGKRDSATTALQEAKKLGLKEEDVHPLERETYRKLLAELDRR